MASPQLSDGFTKIAHETMEALAKINLSPYESRILWFVLRKTYGWKKKSDWIAGSQFQSGLGLDRQNIWRTLKKLVQRQIIVISRDDRGMPIYSFQKDYSKWDTSSNETTASSNETTERRSLNRLAASSKQTHTKDTLTKENTITGILNGSNGGNGTRPTGDPNFERAWLRFPKRAGGNSKKNAEARWKARIRAGVDPEEMIAGVDRYAHYVRATGREGTDYVKQAETFFGPGEHWKEEWKLPADHINQSAGGFVG